MGTLTYEWTTDVSEFVESDVESPEWMVPQIPEEPEVTFTVAITDNGLPTPISIPFTSVPWTVFPAMELSAIQFDSPAQALVDFPITLVREADSGMKAQSFRFPDLPDGVTIGKECNGELSTPFDEEEVTCPFTFDMEGPYTISVDLVDGCASQTQGTPKPRVSYEFTVTVVDP